MSVIAKVNVADDPRSFGDSQLVEFQCVSENLFMAMYNRNNENHLFTKASPSGDGRMNLPQGVSFRRWEELYLIVHRQDEVPAFNGALAVVDAMCISVTEYGGVSKRVELASRYRDYRHPKAHPAQVDSFNFRITIDNPAASVQFQPGSEDYWIGLYRASDMTADEAIALAAC